MKTLNIASIIGEKSYLRLKEKKITTAAAIRRTPPGELMSIAGIGPVKCVELYGHVGKKLNIDEVEKLYRRVKDKTKFSAFREGYNRLVTDPKPIINQLEHRKQELTLWHNFLAGTRNIGRDPKDRMPILTYAPQALVIDPFAMGESTSPESELYAEVFVIPGDDGAKIEYEARDSLNRRAVTEEEFIPKTSSVQMATNVGNVIDEIYKRFRSKTLIGTFVVILDGQYSSFYEGLKDKFRSDIDSQKMILVRNMDDYYEYEAIYKYHHNPIMKEIAKRFDAYHSYMLYDQYHKQGGKESYNEWRYENQENFFDLIAQKQMSHISLETQGLGFNALFGVIKGMPNMMNYNTGRQVSSLNIPFERDLGYEKYVELKRTPSSINIEGINLSSIMSALIHATFEEFTLYEYKGKLVFESKQLPGIGFVYESED